MPKVPLLCISSKKGWTFFVGKHRVLSVVPFIDWS